MRQLIQKLRKVGNSSSKCVQLRSPLLADKECCYSSCLQCKKDSSSDSSVDVPHGYVPVYVGKGSTRFIVKTRFLNYPILAELLQRSAQEYGYEQQGVLKIPCDVVLFQYILCLLNSDDPLASQLRLTDFPDFCKST